MSVIGISPSDLVGGVRVGIKAIRALKTENGAQVQYQAIKQSHDDLHAAVKSLSEACPLFDVPSSTELGQSLKHLLKKHEQQEENTLKYEAALGEGPGPKKRKGIRRKLQWAFQEDKELRDSDARSRPAVDAAILQTLQVQNDIEERDHAAIKNHVSTTTEIAVTRMQQNFGSLADHASNLADEILTENKQQTQGLMAILCSVSQAQERIITKALRDTMRYPVTSPTRSKRQLQHRRCRKRVCKDKSQSEQKRSAPSDSPLPASFPADYQCSEVSCTSIASASTSHLRIDTSCCVADASRAFWALLFTVFYANPQSRRLAGRLWMRAQADPVLALLCLICVVLIQRWLLHVPKHISLLSDNSIAFEDAFGIEIRVPYRQCEQFEFFHGFLEYYFRQRPGLQRVIQKRYRLLLGNARGQIIERTTWPEMVRPKTRLTMAMLLVSAQSQCAKCLGELEPCSKGQIRICFACDQEYSVETLTAHPQRSTSTKSIDYQISETEQLDLPHRHPNESHEVEIADFPLEPASNMMSHNNSGQAVEAPTQEVIAANDFHTRSDGKATDTPQRPSPRANQKPKSVLELELKLFKNMTIRIVPQITPLRPMLPRHKDVDDDHLSTTANASEPSPKKWSERLPPEDAGLTPTIGQQGLKEKDDSEPELLYVRDDMSIVAEPTRHVDYLSHDWDERELVLSWQYVARRRQTLQNSTRLENATWRFWAQKRDALKTVNPESLNWLKDCDITWLYGPLQSESRGHGDGSRRRCQDSLGSSPSVHEKPILIRKSTLAAILERSQSQFPLSQRVGALLKAKEETSFFEQRRESMSDPTSKCGSHVASVMHTPPGLYNRYSFASSQPPTPPKIKHVSFNEDVQQIEDGEQDLTWADHDFDSDGDDDGGLMISPAHDSASRQRATLALQTRRSPMSSHNFLIDDDSELCFEPELPYKEMDAEIPQMRRTASGMFMPYYEDQEDPSHNNTVLDRVSGAVNTAKDITYLLWRK